MHMLVFLVVCPTSPNLYLSLFIFSFLFLRLDHLNKLFPLPAQKMLLSPFAKALFQVLYFQLQKLHLALFYSLYSYTDLVHLVRQSSYTSLSFIAMITSVPQTY